MNKCKYCQSTTQDPDCCCEVCEGIANYWWDWAEAFHQPLACGIEKGMPQWVLEYWTDW